MFFLLLSLIALAHGQSCDLPNFAKHHAGEWGVVCLFLLRFFIFHCYFRIFRSNWRKCDRIMWRHCKDVRTD